MCTHGSRDGVRTGRGPGAAALLLVLATLASAQSHFVPLDPALEGVAVEAWRAQDQILGASCSECHGPDPLDLALMNVGPATIFRRAAPHVDPVRAQAIVDWTMALRQAANVPADRDPREFRPFQPGGVVLPGATAEERDLVFGQTLAFHTPRLMGAPVRTGMDAYEALAQLREVNLREIPIGVPFNRWAEDAFHGPQAASTAEWLPELPHLRAPGMEAAWAQLQDDYLSWPSDENFFQLYDALETHTEVPLVTGTAAAFMKLKYRSVLAGMHVLRQDLFAGRPWRDRAIAAFWPQRMTSDSGPNPVWAMGDFARIHKNVNDWMGLPPAVVNVLSPHTTLRDELEKMRVPWFWAGWLFDQGLQRTSGSNSTKSAEYLTHHLWADSQHAYAIHNAFMILKKNVQENFAPLGWFVPAWAGGGGPRVKVTLSNFAGYGRHVNWAPSDPARREIYRTWVGNAYRAFLIAYEGDLVVNGNVYGRSKLQGFLSRTTAFFQAFSGPEDLPEDLALVQRVEQLMNSLPDA